MMVFEAESPGRSYSFDIGEKDRQYGDSILYTYREVLLKLREVMPAGTVLADFTFVDSKGNKASMKAVDLLKLVPLLETEGELSYAEYLLEEYGRFGISFRREHEEFRIKSEGQPQGQEGAYRARIVNNCLAPSRWEFELLSEDYSDFNSRVKSRVNVNQERILSHSWFYVDKELYAALFRLKNPRAEIALGLHYDSLSARAEKVQVNFEALRGPLKESVNVRVRELGHRSGRPLEPLDIEEYYKRAFGLHLNRDSAATYASILETPVKLSQFTNRGYYYRDSVMQFDFGWLKYIDSVAVDIIAVPGTDCYTQLTLTGRWSPFEITIGNVDLAQLSEQQLFGLQFGINTYPKGRRYNPVQSTIRFDPDLLPAHLKPYALMTDKQSGRFINNQGKGVEKVYLTYDSFEKDILNIYLLSYERITPVWFAQVKLPKAMREKVRTRQMLYEY